MKQYKERSKRNKKGRDRKFSKEKKERKIGKNSNKKENYYRSLRLELEGEHKRCLPV